MSDDSLDDAGFEDVGADADGEGLGDGVGVHIDQASVGRQAHRGDDQQSRDAQQRV